MKSTIEYPPDSGCSIQEIRTSTIVNGERKFFGSAWLATIPQKRGKGRRRRKQCDSLEGAKKWLDDTLEGLEEVGKAYLTLDDRQRADAVSAIHLAEDAGLPLLTVLQDAIAAVKITGASDKLPEAARYWKERKGNLKPILVADAIAELLKSKTQDGVSFVHHKDLRLRLENGFSEKFGLTNVSDLGAEQINEWLRSLDVGKRSRANYRRVVLTFLRFCERRGWLARGAIDGAMIDSPKVKSTEAITIFTPEELRTLLEQSTKKMRPYFVLGGLCGLRTAEALRLDWKSIDFKRNTITVGADKAKTASRRIVPMCDAAREWLLDLKQTTGRVLPYYHISKEVNRLLAKLNKGREEKDCFRWKANGLRHTYISARMAIVEDAASVALEAGNSPAMIFSNYRELMHDDTAAEWFAIMPAKPAENVVQMPKAGAAVG